MSGWRIIRAISIHLFFGSLVLASLADAAENWTIVRSKYFTVLTSASPRTAQLWATQLEHFRVALGQVFPAHAERLRPVTMVIFPNERAFRPYKMRQNGKPAAVDGYFTQSDQVCAIALAIDERPTETRRIIFHEATHWYQSTRDDSLPTWLEEGIAEVFSTFTSDDQDFTVGDPIREHVQYLRLEELPKLTQILGMSRDKIDYESERTGKFYASSWLFAHWLMFGKNTPGSRSVPAYLSALKVATDPEKAFASAFGGNYEEVQQLLQHYLAGGTYIRKTYGLRLAELVPIEPPRPATVAEVEYALGAVAFGSRGAQAALPHLQQAVKLDPTDVHAWELLGNAELALEDKPAALDAYNRATKLGSRIGLIWNNRAELRQQAEHPAGEVFSSDDESSFAADAADFRQAIDLDPHCQVAYTGLAGVVYGVKPPDPADLERFERGCAAFPDDMEIAVGRALARMRTAEAARGEAELRALLARDTLPARARHLGENAIEDGKLKKLRADLDRFAEERRYPELMAEIDQALADEAISRENRESLRGYRKQVDQMRRLDEAVAAFNDGHFADAAKLVRSVIDEPPASWSIKNDAERLLKECEKELNTADK